MRQLSTSHHTMHGLIHKNALYAGNNAIVTSHTLFGYPGNGHLSKNFLLYKIISVISVFHNFT